MSRKYDLSVGWEGLLRTYSMFVKGVADKNRLWTATSEAVPCHENKKSALVPWDRKWDGLTLEYDFNYGLTIGGVNEDKVAGTHLEMTIKYLADGKGKVVWDSNTDENVTTRTKSVFGEANVKF